MTWTRVVMTSLCVLLASFSMSQAQFWGMSGGYGQQQGCSWGTRAVRLPGQCGAFHCAGAWFGTGYSLQCPYGSVFSQRQGRCITPLAVAAQCSGVNARQSGFLFWL